MQASKFASIPLRLLKEELAVFDTPIRNTQLEKRSINLNSSQSNLSHEQYDSNHSIAA
jgi:hypothetical protein